MGTFQAGPQRPMRETSRSSWWYCQPKISTQAFDFNVNANIQLYTETSSHWRTESSSRSIRPVLPCSIFKLQTGMTRPREAARSHCFWLLFYISVLCVFNFRGVGVCLGRARPAISPWLFARKWIIIRPEMLKWTQKGRGREVKERWAIQWQKREKTMKRGEDGQSSEQGLPCRNGFPSMAG